MENLQVQNTVIKYFEKKREDKNCYYVGFKNTNVISIELIKKLEAKGIYKHTLDKMSYKGRAIDIDLINPITGRLMTGSSSGTAINVFWGINDLGIGTDGGGSALAPALSLNLYGFISPLIDFDHMKKYEKESTDGIKFTPSIGFISKDIEKLAYIIDASIEMDKEPLKKDLDLILSKAKISYHNNLYERFKKEIYYREELELTYKGLDRRLMIKELGEIDFDSSILISFEGPIDIFGYGDSVLGHYSTYTRQIQEYGHKYYLKVINMLNLSAFVIPSEDLALGCLIVCKSEPSYIRAALDLARSIDFKRSKLEEEYFS